MSEVQIYYPVIPPSHTTREKIRQAITDIEQERRHLMMRKGANKKGSMGRGDISKKLVEIIPD